METTSISELISWHRQTDDLIRQGSCTNPAFIKPYHLAVLAAKMNAATDRTVHMPKGDLEHYAARMHLWQVLGQEPPVLMNEYQETGRFQPLTSIQSDDDVSQIADQIIELFQPICTDDVTKYSIYSLVVEILGNCVAHAGGMESEPYGFVCGQVWKRARRAQIAVIDSGIGIRQTLECCGQYGDRLATENACTLATEYSVTSKAGNGHSGYGLTLARDLMMQNGGALHILSVDEWFSSSGVGGLHAGTIADLNLYGTLIVLEWDTSRPLNSGAVYARWPNEQKEDEDDDFNWDF